MSRKVAEGSQELEMDEEDKEKVSLKDSEDYMDSQESEGSFAKRLDIDLTEDVTGSQE